jgi:hypothetical protein
MPTTISSIITQRDREQLILYCDGFRLEKTDKKHKLSLDDLILLEYNYIFDYQTVFYGKRKSLISTNRRNFYILCKIHTIRSQ